MVCQPLDPYGQMVVIERFDDLHDLSVQRTPQLWQEALISHLMREGMLEGVGAIREQVSLKEKFGTLQVGQALVECLYRQLHEGLEEAGGHLLANHCGDL